MSREPGLGQSGPGRFHPPFAITRKQLRHGIIQYFRNKQSAVKCVGNTRDCLMVIDCCEHCSQIPSGSFGGQESACDCTDSLPFQGDRDMEYVETGMNRERMRWLGRIAPEQNLYYQVAVYYPELLFVTMALNDFVRLYAKKIARSAVFPLTDKRVLWDPAIAKVRLLQSQVDACLKDAISPASYKRIINLMHHDYPWMDNYYDQYLDLLNIRYLELEHREARKKALLTTVKRMVEQGPEYHRLIDSVREFARDSGCPVEAVNLAEGYPDTIDW